MLFVLVLLVGAGTNAQDLASLKALLHENPSAALDACRRVAGPAVWPVMLEADVKLNRWEAAERVGAALMPEIEAGRIFPRLADIPEEVSARRFYAEALEHQEHDSREQRCAVRQLEHAVDNVPCASIVAGEQQRRIAILKTGLLASAVKYPAPSLAALDAHRDQIRIVAFWASWCAPCVTELAQLREYRNPDAAVVPIDIDALDRATRRAYLPLETLESTAVPQLYVIDAGGDIRFHVVGFEDDGFFGKRLDWMIEASK